MLCVICRRGGSLWADMNAATPAGGVGALCPLLQAPDPDPYAGYGSAPADSYGTGQFAGAVRGASGIENANYVLPDQRPRTDSSA